MAVSAGVDLWETLICLSGLEAWWGVPGWSGLGGEKDGEKSCD